MLQYHFYFSIKLSNCNDLDCECDKNDNFTNTQHISSLESTIRKNSHKSVETKYKISTEMELSDTVYDLSTLIDISTHSDNIYGNSTTENNATHN